MGITTCSTGFKYKAIRDITKSSFISIIDRLGEVFGDGWTFDLESVCEGGIIVEEWPGKTSEMYKSLRFDDSVNKWPGGYAPRTAWENNADVVWPAMSIRPRTDWSTSFLKAFHFAPPWTTEELKLIAGVFEEFGIITQKVKAPR